jgi:glutathione S-transferase
MSDIVLHHFDASPFAEKIRVALGLKGLDWRSVEIPMVMPKPDLTALTGGYRKTPVMQIGCDVYCDTRRIALELEQRFATPSLFPGGCRSQALAISAWGDRYLFQPGAGLSMGTNLDLPEEILADRFAFFDFLDRDTLPEQLPHLFGQFRAQLVCVEDMLDDGRTWLLGQEPSWADAAVYASVWMCRGNIQGSDDLLAGLNHLLQWEQRVASLGHGSPSSWGAEQAHALARASTSVVEPCVDLPWATVALDDEVTVTPDDYGAVPVPGRLMRLTAQEIAIEHENATVGTVVVHFPLAGYRVAHRT